MDKQAGTPKHEPTHFKRCDSDAIQMRFDGERFAYSRENNLVYIVALGATRKKWLADNLYPNDVEIRECLNAKQLKLVELLTFPQSNERT